MEALDLPMTALPTIRLAGRFALADRGFETVYRGVAHALHLHDYPGRMRLAGREIDLAPGDVTLSPARLPSAYDLDRDGRHWCVHFIAGREDGTMFALPLRLSGAGATRERFAAIAALHARAASSARAQAAAALHLLLLALADRGEAAPDPASRAAAAIDERFAEPLSVSAIAAAARCSPPHLARMFKARFGVTVPHRLLQRRVEHARYLLESTDLPIWRVAERVGIPDPQHFNKTVRRLTGLSPSGLRARAAGEPIDPDR